MSEPCTIIAEAGVNHNGSLDMAFRLVDAARAAGADWVKFQTFSASKIATRSAPMASYQARNQGGGDSQYEMLKKLELPLEAFGELSAYCRSSGIRFMSTPFDIEAAHYLAGIGMDTLKIPSGEITNLPFLRELGRMELPVILSTGMADLGEVEDAVAVLEKAGTPLGRMTILHCTTEYPAPADEINLRAMATLKAAFPGAAIGYSDHSEGFDITVAAVALGAGMVEKHFTLDRNLPGPDHKASLEPHELAAMTASIRRIESALGDGRKRPTASEIPNKAVARKSIVAARDIARGERLAEGVIEVRRPGNGLSPMRWDEVVGTVATRDYKAGELIGR